MTRKKCATLIALLVLAVFSGTMAVLPTAHGKDWTITEVVSTESTDDSWSPSLAVSPDGTVHIAWEERISGFGSDLCYKKYVPCTGWTVTEAVSTESPYGSRRPSLAVGSDGTVHIAWSGTIDYYEAIYYRRYIPSIGWTTIEKIVDVGVGGYYEPSLGVGPDGTIHVAWTFQPPARVGVRVLYGGSQLSWDDSWSPSLAVGSDGTVHIAFVYSTHREYPGDPDDPADIFYRRYEPDNGLMPAEMLSNEITNSIAPSIAVGSDGTVHIAWQENGIMYRRYEPEIGWTTMEAISTTGRNPSLVIGPDERVHVAWFDNHAILYRNYMRGTGWTTVEKIVDLVRPYYYDLSLAVGIDETVHISWSDYVDYGQYDIFYKKKMIGPWATVCSVWTTDADGDPRVKCDYGETVYVHWEADGMVNMAVYAPDGVTIEQKWTSLPSSGVYSLAPSHGNGIYEIRCMGAEPTRIAIGTFFVIPELPLYGSLLALTTMLGTFFIMRKRMRAGCFNNCV